ncbi:unnamed protein product [Nesidiocoris tenuis]|uniref:Uncharacterized protein n=1 Tax=Nesidiocoris tenuis TaxID=355587 RepID=A0A6H5FZ94_9HEMI|nr:unnamed protein product [Nesidiocoris tenuis]
MSRQSFLSRSPSVITYWRLRLTMSALAAERRNQYCQKREEPQTLKNCFTNFLIRFLINTALRKGQLIWNTGSLKLASAILLYVHGGAIMVHEITPRTGGSQGGSCPPSQQIFTLRGMKSRNIEWVWPHRRTDN